ncbi:MAG: winged helix-turn-helix domain-containing protein [Prevotella sp.]|jgi:DNA-binding response OmpR family regulator|nr:winged helix-turn-helix domain-containing protein [Prevotella sp.]
MKSKIILLESDSDLACRLKTDLERKGFHVIPVSTDSVQTVDELVLRISNLADREDATGKSYLMGNVTFIPEEHLLKYSDKEIQLRNNENILLKLLYDNRNRVVSKEVLVAEIWNETDPKMKDQLLNNLIYTIREKLMHAPGITLKTIPKEGYKLYF